MFARSAMVQMRDIAVLARLGSSPNPPRIAITLAKLAAWCAIGAVAAVVAIPVLALLSAVTGH